MRMNDATNVNISDSSSTFTALGIAPKILDALAKAQFSTPTPIQKQAIPAAIQGKDLIGIAQTGTGKTLAFGIPMIQRLAQVKGKGLVVLPTRELALQVEEALQLIGRTLGLRIAVLIGGASIGAQIKAIKKNPHIIVGTPGRIIDHLNQKTLQLADTRVLVLDEADRMLDMGFAPQIKKILNEVPSERQTMLFSATMPPEIIKIATQYMKLPIRIEVAPTGTLAERVTHEIFIISKDAKTRLLDKLLQGNPVTTLIFTRTKHGAKKLAQAIRAMGHTASEIHSNRSLNQRREALEGFKSGKYRVLVATDIASRGIDVVGIALVINYDLPEIPGDYIHRIGRTARAGAGGHAISFVTPDQRRDLHDIERLIRKQLPISQVAELPPARAVAPRTGREPFSRSRDNRQDGGAPHKSHESGRRSSRKRRRPFGNRGGFRRR